MDDLARWLGEQLDIDTAGVSAATWADDATTWHAAPSPYDTWGKNERWYVEDAMDEGVITHVDPKAAQDDGVARHIAEWDPARVLAEINAKRRTLIRCQEAMFAVSPMLVHFAKQTLREMALPFSERPGYAEAIASVE